MTIPPIDGIQGLATSGTEVTSFSTHVFTKIRRDGMRKSMQSILGILTGTAIAATTMLGVAMAKPGNTECIAPAGQEKKTH